MFWNWQLADWPNFYFEQSEIVDQEKNFLINIGANSAFLKNIDKIEYSQFVVEILSQEGLESSKIEGEYLDRESLQSSIRQHFGLKIDRKNSLKKESQMAELLFNVYETFNKPLTHEMLWDWHSKLFTEESYITDKAKYRTHREPMQIVSSRYQSKVFFEAPPSDRVPKEMEEFIDWFNRGDKNTSIIGRAAIAHLYFENIHPFEDGNGRIGRMLVEKILSQSVNRPALIAVSKVLEKRKKEYYAELEKCNRTLNVSNWVKFFADVILQAQDESLNLLFFLIKKSKIFTTMGDQINSRQEKVLLRIFAEGLSGFKGGLSADNYLAITKTSRATATRDLADLVEKGILKKTGELRHTRYWINLDNTFN